MKECCEACDGSGKMHGDTCRYCKGVGWFEDQPESTPEPEQVDEDED